jgi:hypothetical protein
VKFVTVQALPVHVQVVVPPVCVAETNVIFVIVPSETLAFVMVVGNPVLVFVTVTANVTLLPTVTRALFAGDVIATVMFTAANAGDAANKQKRVRRIAPKKGALARWLAARQTR